MAGAREPYAAVDPAGPPPATMTSQSHAMAVQSVR
jgi:hypothetical protein